MKRFNICLTHGQTLLRGTRHAIELPKYCFYGKDSAGLYYVLDTHPYQAGNGQIWLEMYRFKNSRWQRGMESGETVELIHAIAMKNRYYGLRQEKCLHMHGVVQSRTQTPGSRHTKSMALKDVSRVRNLYGTYSN